MMSHPGTGLGITFLLLMCVGQRSEGQAPIVPKLSIQDQFGHTHDLVDFRGDVVLLIYADKEGAEASKNLGARFQVTFHPDAKGQPPAKAVNAAPRSIPDWPKEKRVPDVRVTAIASLGAVPGFLRNHVRSRFLKASPDTPVWLDFEEQTGRQLGMKPGVPNIAIIDATGRLRHRMSGLPSEEQYTELEKIIERLRGEMKTE